MKLLEIPRNGLYAGIGLIDLARSKAIEARRTLGTELDRLARRGEARLGERENGRKATRET